MKKMDVMKVPQVHVNFLCFQSSNSDPLLSLLKPDCGGNKVYFDTKFLIRTRLSEMTGISVLVKREDGHADLGDKMTTTVSPCEESDAGDN